MKRIHYIFLAAALLLTGCERQAPLSPVADNRPIEFGFSGELSVDSKAVYDSATDLTGDGFIVWSSLTTNPENLPETASGPSIGYQPAIFGNGGTKVYAPSWTYSPTRYWQRGMYTFAAALPASAFNASYSTDSTPTETPSAPYGTHTGTLARNGDNIIFSTNQLTLNFGASGYNLAVNQDDIMVAFDNVDNRNGAMGTIVGGVMQKVDLDFEHQLSRIVIQGANTEPRTDIRINQIKVYGNHTSTDGNMVFTYNGTVVTPYFGLTGQTNETDVYRTLIPSSSQDWTLTKKTGSSETYTTLVSDLLVFPEECSFTIEVTYTDLYNGNNGVQTMKTGTLSADWEAGKKYTYKFTIDLDNIAFAEPTVEPWPETANNLDTDIEM